MALLLLIAACGSDSKPLPQLTLPPVDPRLDVLGKGRITIELAAGGSQTIDPRELAEQQDADVPPCAGFVFLFSWQVQRSQSLQFSGTIQGVVIDIADGQSGNASTSGCMLLEVKNQGGEPASGELRYVLADSGS